MARVHLQLKLQTTKTQVHKHPSNPPTLSTKKANIIKRGHRLSSKKNPNDSTVDIQRKIDTQHSSS
jgi:hypothetical protein